MARPRKQKDFLTTVSFRLSDADIAALDALAVEWKRTRTGALRMVVEKYAELRSKLPAMEYAEWDWKREKAKYPVLRDAMQAEIAALAKVVNEGEDTRDAVIAEMKEVLRECATGREGVAVRAEALLRVLPDRLRGLETERERARRKKGKPYSKTRDLYGEPHEPAKVVPQEEAQEVREDEAKAVSAYQKAVQRRRERLGPGVDPVAAVVTALAEKNRKRKRSIAEERELR